LKSICLHFCCIRSNQSVFSGFHSAVHISYFLFHFFSDSLNLITHWQGCEREVAEAGDAGERKSESIMRLSWALVHSRQPEDVQRGIAMLEGT
jgi:hypothetical protein